MSKHIYLTGYRGTGKTSVGAIVAQSLSMPMVDLDDLVEKHAGKSIREIFADGGEAAFRLLESQTLIAIADWPPRVISLGGGAILDPQNRTWIAQHGLCLWLDADAETLAARIADDQTTAARRPDLTQWGGIEEIRQLLAVRSPIYQQVADIRIDTRGKSVAEVADEAVRFCQPKM